MPRWTHSPIRDAVGSVLDKPLIEQLARELGVVERQRKVRITAFVAAVVLGFATGAQRSLAGMRRAYEHATGQSLAPSGFYSRFTPELVDLFQRLVERAISQLQERTPRLKQSLARFKDLLVADGSLIKLHRCLARFYPSVFPNQVGAAAKLHVVLNVTGRSARSVQIVSGSRHDSTILKVGPWVAGKLLLLDLAYRKGLLYKRIGDHGGYFLLRKKDNDDPVIDDGSQRRLSDITKGFRGKPIDVAALVPWRFDRGTNRRRQLLKVRLVGQWNPTQKRHHFYITNAPPDMLAAEHVGPIYAGRWEVELFFRELKLTHRLEQIPSRKRFVAEALIRAALLSLLVSRSLRERLLRLEQRFAPERWARLVATFALDILNAFVTSKPSSTAETRLARVLRREAPDPNRRPNLLQRVQLGRFRVT